MDERRDWGEAVVRLFVEGGGDGKRNRNDFQQGFRALIRKVAAKTPRIVACGSRQNALDKFCLALSRGENALLLVDSEALIAPQNVGRPWAHLAEQDKWEKPFGASDDDAHLMAQCMESWFVADPDALAAHFGWGFSPAKLPQNPKVEEVAKSDVMSGLRAATRKTGSGEYHKTRDGFALIGKINPLRVETRALHAKRFFDILRRKLGAQPAS